MHEGMNVAEVASSVLSYFFTTIIYLFILAVIGLIYLDIKKTSEKERNSAKSGSSKNSVSKSAGVKVEKKELERFAILRTVKNRAAVSLHLNGAYRISGRGIVVGRGKRCDIIADDMYLSAAHFRIWCESGKWYICDLNSKNGTYLNGTRLAGEKQLKYGSEIAFGQLKFIFEEDKR